MISLPSSLYLITKPKEHCDEYDESECFISLDMLRDQLAARFQLYSFDQESENLLAVNIKPPKIRDKSKEYDKIIKENNQQQNEQRNEIKSKKSSHHPIIRLFDTVRLCTQLICFLTFVPTNITCSQHNSTNTTHLQQIGEPRIYHSQSLIQQPNLEWAKQLTKTSNTVQQTNMPSTYENLIFAGVGSNEQHQLSSQPINFAANQAQKILKNLVSSTIVDLVPQFKANKTSASRSSQLQQSIHNTNSRYFPTKSKLYTNLFPKTSQFERETNLPFRINLRRGGNSKELIHPSSSNNHNIYITNETQKMFHHHRALKGSTFQDNKQIISLSAPYESRPGPLNQTPAQKPDNKESASNWSHRSANESVRNLLRDQSNTMLYDHQPEVTIEEKETSKSGAPLTETNVDMIGSYDSSVLNQSNPPSIDQEDSDQKTMMHDEQEINSADENIQHLSEPDLHNVSDQDYGFHYARNENNHSEEVADNQSLLNEMTELGNHKAAKVQEPAIVDSAGTNFNQHRQHLDNVEQSIGNQTQYLQSGEQQIAQQVNNMMNENVYVNSQPQSANMTGEQNFKGMLLNETFSHDDESFLAAQLPSQYDAVIRLPPDGYYDDYYKPSSSNATSYASLPASLLGRQANIPEFSSFHQPIEKQLSQQQQHERSRQGESFELEKAISLTEGNVIPQQINQNHHSHYSPTNYITLGEDYTKQYYMSQQPLKQNETLVDQSVEFITPSRSWKNSDERVIMLNTDKNMSSRHKHNVTIESLRPQVNVTTSRYHNIGSINETQDPSSIGFSNSNEDSIQLIIANTNNSSRDPLSNEKIINYTNEGHNITRSTGESPRNTFFNKDMNEIPPDYDKHNIQSNVPSNGHPSTVSPSLQLVENWNNPIRGLEQMQLLQRPVVQPKRTGQEEEKEKEEDEANIEMKELHAYESDELQRLTKVSNNNNNKNGMYSNGNQSEEPTGVRALASVGGSRNSLHQFNAHNNSDQVERSSGNISNTANKVRKQRNNREERFEGERLVRHKSKFSNKHQRIPRPEVTQVNFNPKDLILKQPTILSSTRGTLDTIAEIPSKVKQLRDTQPDKNELMNELLTALDRVKVAIYKLQPLTAKMNAIYRKSVTSNTRDIVMDNHKGTYAKRYPPGDYDDTYDRMHPSELLNRQLSSRQRRAHPASDRMETSESAFNAVYLPAPKELLESYKQNLSILNRDRTSNSFEIDVLNESESQIVATGIGRRIVDGHVGGHLKLTLSDGTIYDDEINNDTDNKNSHAKGNITIDQATSSLMSNSDERPLFDSQDKQGPLFGYRIFIIQSPESEDEIDETNSAQFSYQADGIDDVDQMEVDNDSDELSTRNKTADDDAMVTSESSIVTFPFINSQSNNENGSRIGSLDPDELFDQSESEGKKRIEEMMKKKSEHVNANKKKGAKERDEKRENLTKSNSKGKKDEEESMKKKQYKKIKHNKGFISKEKKTMHRDKHIKSHDRGAAKEKALKERTQIEFFEREQIVDDEFEKGKKSALKADWHSGHDSKKTIKDSLGDNMSLGGSHYVKHEPKDVYAEKSHGIGLEILSVKGSNKLEKKNMETKGKKFKGWREKGYKIITETEFIDRGSLHDSAYKKKDRGAAHHQKYKKQEASSVGHQGSMHEHNKKSQKKEEKMLKMNDKKRMKKTGETNENEKKKKMMTIKKKEKQKQKKSIKEIGEENDTLDVKESIHNMSLNQRSAQPILISTSSSTYLPTEAQLIHSSQRSSLAQLINANHDKEPVKLARREDLDKNSTLALDRLNLTFHPNLSTVSRFKLLNEGPIVDSKRRSADRLIPRLSVAIHSQNQSNNYLNNLNRSNATILDIVDNLTGRQMNKTKIGTYELDEHNTIRLAFNNSMPQVRINNGLAKHFPSLSQSAVLKRNNESNVIRITNSEWLQNGPNIKRHAKKNIDEPLLIDLIKKTNLQYQQQKSESIGDLYGRNIPKMLNLFPEKPAKFITQADRVQGYTEAAANHSQLVQRAARADKVFEQFTNQPPTSLIQSPNNFQTSANHQQAAFLRPLLPTKFQDSYTFTPADLSFEPNGPGLFGADQFFKYEQDLA